MLQRLLQMLLKEFIQVFRDKRTRMTLILPPIIQTLVFGYAATFEIRHVPIVVLDFDHSQESRELISRFEASPNFRVVARLVHREQLAHTVDSGRAAIAIQIHAGFAEKLRKGETGPVQVVVDGTNSNTALIALSYVNQIAERFAREYQQDRLRRLTPFAAPHAPRVELERRPWFNEDLRSRWFFVPGVVGNIAAIMVISLTAFAVVREREIGTLEQVMVTPIRRAEFILGKTVPFFLVGLADMALIATVGTLWFEIPFRGHLGVLVLGTTLFLLSMLGVGLLISTVSATQQQAMVTTFFFLMPAMTFSGFGFPILAMPPWLQKITYLDPLRYFMEVIRGVYLKGVGLEVLWPQMAALGALGAALLAFSVLRFRKSLD
jgi:ABC-2 type transport system permease protein